MKRVATVLALLFVAVAPVFGQNLLENPGFDVPDQLDGWSCTSANGVAAWNSEDRRGSPGSGSVQHDVSASANNRTINCSQCVPVTEAETYLGSVWHHWPDDADVTQDGSTRLSILWYSTASCTGLIDWVAPAIHSYPPNPLDTWTLLQSQPGTAPAGTAAARVEVYTWQDLANEPVRSRIDDVWFAPYIDVFSDGFESGDISAWSGSTP